jgi:molecular chaperone HscB
LDREYWGLQKALHPDNFGSASESQQELSATHSALINRAYNTLKDPLKRAKYLLRLKGRGDIFSEDEGSGSSGGGGGLSRLTLSDPMMLMEVMETREAVEECDDVAGLEALLHDAKGKVEGLTAELGVLFEDEERLDQAQEHVMRLVYATKLVEEIREKKLKFELEQ